MNIELPVPSASVPFLLHVSEWLPVTTVHRPTASILFHLECNMLNPHKPKGNFQFGVRNHQLIEYRRAGIRYASGPAHRGFPEARMALFGGVPSRLRVTPVFRE